MVRLGVVGLGKMGLSHYAMINAHPDVKVEAALLQKKDKPENYVCDLLDYVL